MTKCALHLALTVFIVLLNCLLGFRCADLQGLLSSESDKNYASIHRLILENQVNFYQPAQKSIHTRASKSLDGIYDFCLDNSLEGFDKKWHSHDLEHKCNVNNFYRMPVPSAFNEITSNQSVRDYVGWFWYQTEVGGGQDHLLPKAASKRNEDTYIQFENVNYLAIVWVQPLAPRIGQDRDEAILVGSHVGGYLPFIINLSQALGRKNVNSPFRLTIAVNNNLTDETIPSGGLLDLSEQVGRDYRKFVPDFDFFHFAGIMGSVHLLRLPKVHISEVRQRHKIKCNHFEDSSASQEQCIAEFEIYPSQNGGQLLADKEANNRQVSPCELRFRLELWLKQSLLLASAEASSSCEPTVIAIPINRSLLWQLAEGRVDYFAPQLRVRIKLSAGDEKKSASTDLYELKVAFRQTELSDLFGGRQLQGFGMHQEQLFSGRSVGQATLMKDIYLLKQWGANVIRTSHYPYSEQFLEACQENGIALIAECAAVGLKSFSEHKLKLHKQLLKEMMQRDHNNAAIVAWSVANEPESQHSEARAYFMSLLEFVRDQLTSYTVAANRPLTAAIAQSHGDDKIGDLLDMIMVNRYYGWYEFTGIVEAIRRPLVASLSGWARKYPHAKLLISEFGADTLAGLHSLDGEELFSEEFQARLIVEHERVFDELFELSRNESQTMNFIGSMVWNFADFSTHASLVRPGGNRKGIFTRDRRPKAAALELQRIYRGRILDKQSLSTYNRVKV